MKMKELLEEAKSDLEEIRKKKAKQELIWHLIERESGKMRKAKQDKTWDDILNADIDKGEGISHDDILSYYRRQD